MPRKTNIPFEVIAWSQLPLRTASGEKGETRGSTKQYDGLRIRHVEYCPGYLADHWCEKGHVIFCIEGEFVSELSTGQKHVISAGMGYVVSDGLSSHRSHSEHGAKLLIIDGDFLSTNQLT